MVISFHVSFVPMLAKYMQTRHPAPAGRSSTRSASFHIKVCPHGTEQNLRLVSLGTTRHISQWSAQAAATADANSDTTDVVNVVLASELQRLELHRVGLMTVVPVSATTMTVCM